MSVFCNSICVYVFISLGLFCKFLGAQFLDKYLLYGCAPSRIVTNVLRINTYLLTYYNFTKNDPFEFMFCQKTDMNKVNIYGKFC